MPPLILSLVLPENTLTKLIDPTLRAPKKRNTTPSRRRAAAGLNFVNFWTEEREQARKGAKRLPF